MYFATVLEQGEKKHIPAHFKTLPLDSLEVKCFLTLKPPCDSLQKSFAEIGWDYQDLEHLATYFLSYFLSFFRSRQ